ncbi:hypothetical protein CcaverHIS002_0702500 [Cutaneotrichosporon cavernicola]|uniref:Protein AF-9 homolog n=1 Tax=Cutaneotrichosporon cavernicola TaxID=279322 RepID=A0AA48L9Y0_9TREE|nr:uncharacterized protein CcaverHIS019_0702580 [Cutaneotrichosporon cavernicola]BEI86904.1 hypothetical protein CcaverHIS002_0702500 [Cutaneotrichosporon cavernicola]BEI94677.1 hypothetical protein CcaverHIS019_0702580 [Cutaneotrichosporon cavernicola]BEJ02452.1 hypothetical protein CcaverHIS631_0702470 [Cutaneotrichosporon cavernicola]BEJ10211.1 hypothetical protein CcaverHIS641_0702460 [Cutaneotrichosporon cavernicola]
MSGNERVRGIQVHRPIIYGSQARLLTEEERALAPPGHTHRWTVFLTSAATPLPTKTGQSSTDAAPVDMDKDYLPGGADDMTYMIKRVVFRLHETYSNPNRMCEKPPYKVTETGWGEFTVSIKVTFVPEASEKALSLQHPIKLHHWGEPLEAQAPQPETTAAETPKNGDEMKMEAGTPKPDGEAEASLAPTETSATEAATPAEATTGAATPVEPVIINPYATSVGTYPVHAWQYDEMVFSDPPANFLTLLEQNPPTPLPSRPRRPRDQRDEHELKTGKKRTKLSGARTGNTSRAGTEAPEGMTTRAGTPASVATPAPGQPPIIGVSGELGSADVPFEFSTDMEKGEFNRLTETRVKIVREMDRWREKLIAQEKELVKLKEELKNSMGVL